MNRILVINPGATSTKIAVFEDERVILKQTINHTVQELKGFVRIIDQLQYRLDLILTILQEQGIELSSLAAIVGRGGLLKPLNGGTYQVNPLMVADLEKAERGEHASNLGAVLAKRLADEVGISAYIVDPVSVDEMEPVARLSGLPELERVSMFHALNIRAVARKVCQKIGKSFNEANLIVVHLGTGISGVPLKKGKAVDVNNPREDGAFSADRSGALPVNLLVKLCYSGKYTYSEMKEKLSTKGGIYAYLGTTDLRETEKMASEGNLKADLVLDALTYQVAKDIGAMATVLEGEVDSIVLTGGMANSKRIVNDIMRRVKFIAPVKVVPGEEELEALALGALRVLRSEEKAQEYI